MNSLTHWRITPVNKEWQIIEYYCPGTNLYTILMDLIIIIQAFEFLLIKQCNQNILTVHKNLKAPSTSNNGRWGKLKKNKNHKRTVSDWRKSWCTSRLLSVVARANYQPTVNLIVSAFPPIDALLKLNTSLRNDVLVILSTIMS